MRSRPCSGCEETRPADVLGCHHKRGGGGESVRSAPSGTALGPASTRGLAELETSRPTARSRSVTAVERVRRRSWGSRRGRPARGARRPPAIRRPRPDKVARPRSASTESLLHFGADASPPAPPTTRGRERRRQGARAGCLAGRDLAPARLRALIGHPPCDAAGVVAVALTAVVRLDDRGRAAARTPAISRQMNARAPGGRLRLAGRSRGPRACLARRSTTAARRGRRALGGRASRGRTAAAGGGLLDLLEVLDERAPRARRFLRVSRSSASRSLRTSRPPLPTSRRRSPRACCAASSEPPSRSSAAPPASVRLPGFEPRAAIVSSSFSGEPTPRPCAMTPAPNDRAPAAVGFAASKPDDAERGQRHRGRDGLPVPRDRLRVDATSVSHIRAAVATAIHTTRTEAKRDQFSPPRRRRRKLPLSASTVLARPKRPRAQIRGAYGRLPAGSASGPRPAWCSLSSDSWSSRRA